jgi:hypothetical protein
MEQGNYSLHIITDEFHTQARTLNMKLAAEHFGVKV